MALMELTWGVLQLKGDSPGDQGMEDMEDILFSPDIKVCLCSFALECHSHQVLQQE